jgi:hypothetical protein
MALEKRRDRRFVPSTPNSLANPTRVLLAAVERLRAGLEWRRFELEKGRFCVGRVELAVETARMERERRLMAELAECGVSVSYVRSGI